LLLAVPILARLGQLEEAEGLLAEHVAAQGSDDVQSRVAYALGSSALSMAQGRFAEALAAVRAGIPELGIDNLLAKEAAVIAVEAALMGDDQAAAREHLEMMEGLPPGELTPYLRAQASRLRARFEAKYGPGDRVEASFKAAAGLFRELSMPFWLAVTLLEQGEWLVGQGREDETAAMFAEAQESFERLKAHPWLERLSTLAPAAEKVGA
jgi:hypothetical protein